LGTDLRMLTVIGARPQFVKAAAVSRAIAAHNANAGVRHIDECLLHTGQHYDANMSAVFFQELGIPEPRHHLNVGSGSHAGQTGDILVGVERVVQAERPDCVLVYGDTNSTLAGAMAAAKLSVPVVHVEAGLRSFNRAMPEEINRILADAISDLLLCPSRTAVGHLAREGIMRGVHEVGDVMYDSVLHHATLASERSTIVEQLGLSNTPYVLATLHRAENTDRPDRLLALLATLSDLPVPVVLPLHPRTRAAQQKAGDMPGGSLRIIEPVGYLDMLALICGSQMVLTDSGGMQKEAYWLDRPCVTLREETEWVELVEAGVNRLAGTDRGRVMGAFDWALGCRMPPEKLLYGDGQTARRIVELLLSHY